MIRIATVHHHSTEWIELQRTYLDRFVREPFTLYGSLEGVDPEAHGQGFDVLVPALGDHAGKLNLMGRVMVEDGAPDDLLVFLDGDAFPVGDAIGVSRGLLADGNDLVAVQRLENHGDAQPHPCFCVVPARTWSDLPGDWSGGYPFRPKRTDVGANLLWLLEQRGLRWAPLLRSNTVNPHPLLFAVYGDVLYHHGAGFRGMKPPGKGRTKWESKRPSTPMNKAAMDKMMKNVPKEKMDAIIARAMEDAALSDQMYQRILANPDFYLELLAPSGSA